MSSCKKSPSSCYVHVPICQRRCRYCDFYSTEQTHRAEEITNALIRELNLRAKDLQTPLKTIFIGGGTPSALDAASLEKLLAALGEYAGKGTEFSIELNCNSLDTEKAGILAANSVNRVSIGVQSFNDSELATLGRLHDAAAAAKAVQICRGAGRENISIDLIYGIPGQSLSSWRNSLESALDCGLKHLSCYCLSYPEGTELARQLRKGQIAGCCEDFELDCYNMAIDLLAPRGLGHYEISNFAAAEEYRCRHNMVYWQNGEYLGVGPSAVSFIDGRRTKNVADLDKWLDLVSSGSTAEDLPETETLSGKMLMAETIMLALRLTEGLSYEEFERRFGCDLSKSFARSFEKNISAGLLIDDGKSVRLARKALFVSDSVLADFIDEAGSDSNC